PVQDIVEGHQAGVRDAGRTVLRLHVRADAPGHAKGGIEEDPAGEMQDAEQVREGVHGGTATAGGPAQRSGGTAIPRHPRWREGVSHAGLMGAMGENTARGPSALAQALAAHHEAWLAYTRADCELAGTLAGAGSSWPTVHGLGCHAGVVEERVEVLRGATACLQQLDADITDFDRLECLQGLVARSMQPD